MRRISLLIAILMSAFTLSVPAAHAAYDDLPRTFSECVRSGGDIRSDGGELTCRLIRAYDFRVYGFGTTECGERIDLEIWGETRTGVVTYVLQPTRTVELPEVGGEGMALPEGPFPCHGD